MSLAELPSKIVESASSLTIGKMQICCEILKISYEQKINLEEVVKDYTTTFNALKDLTPPEQTTHFIKKHYKMVTVLMIACFLCLLILATYFLGQHFKYTEGFLSLLSSQN